MPIDSCFILQILVMSNNIHKQENYICLHLANQSNFTNGGSQNVYLIYEVSMIAITIEKKGVMLLYTNLETVLKFCKIHTLWCLLTNASKLFYTSPVNSEECSISIPFDRQGRL